MNFTLKTIFCSACFFLLNTSQLFSQENIEVLPKSINAKIEIGPEFIWPSSNYQTIHTASINALFGTNYFKKAKLNIDVGVTATFAWGTSLDWYTSANNNLIYIKTSAFGAGPVLKFSQNIFEINRFSISGTASAGAILYDKNFPPGGDFYNFMLRAGLDFGYNLNKNISLKLNTKWLHVSNGQGSGPHNPYYEGYGLGITVTKFFYK